MRRRAHRVWAITLSLLAAGCAASPGPMPPSRERVQWSRLCDRLYASAAVAPAWRHGPRSADEDVRLAAVARHAAPAVVHVEASTAASASPRAPDGAVHPMSTAGGGSGVVIARDGLILTNEHVVRGAATVRVVLADGSAHPAERVCADSKLDLAIVRIAVQDLRALSIGGPPLPNAGVVAIARRHPDAAEESRRGVVTAEAVSLQDSLDPSHARCYSGLIECTAAVEPGFSGGPVLDADGRLVGLTVAVAGRSHDSRAYAIPLTHETCDAIAQLCRRATESQPVPAASR